MNWHYLTDGDQQAGPVTDADFNALVQSGTVNANTMVWRDGMAQWTRYGDIGNASPALATVAGSHRCVECGNTFPESDMIAFENAWVCASCKPTFVQKLKEGVAPAGTLQYAGFWIRFCAKFIDGIAIQIVNIPLKLFVGAAVGNAGRAAPVMAMFIGLIGFAIGITYVVYFNGRFGATPGKMALKLKIVRSNGDPIDYMRAFGRYFAELLSSLILCIGFMMAGWDEQKRALHDRICDTRVIRC